MRWWLLVLLYISGGRATWLKNMRIKLRSLPLPLLKMTDILKPPLRWLPSGGGRLDFPAPLKHPRDFIFIDDIVISTNSIFEIKSEPNVLFPYWYVAPAMDPAFTRCHLSDGALRLNASQEIPWQLVLTECASAGHLLEKKEYCLSCMSVCTFVMLWCVMLCFVLFCYAMYVCV